MNGIPIDEVARLILDRIGSPPGLAVLDIPVDDTGWTTEVAVPLGAHGVRSATAFYSLVLPEPDAVAELASQIQDVAIEETGGQALPPCPGHPHPLSPHVVDGVAVWECPRDPARHREPILP